MLRNNQIIDNEMYEHHFFQVEKNHDLIRIDKFLLLRLPNTTRTKIQKSISAGNVLPEPVGAITITLCPFIIA